MTPPRHRRRRKLRFQIGGYRQFKKTRSSKISFLKVWPGPLKKRRNMVTSEKQVKYLFIVIFLTIIYLAYILIKPFISVILTSVLLAYIFYPLYKLIYKKTKRESFSALTTSILVVLIVSLPFAYIIAGIANEANQVLVKSRQSISSGELFDVDCSPDKIFCKIPNKLKEYLSNPETRLQIQEGIKQITTFVIKKTSNFLLSLPRFILDVFLVIFLMFYIFKEGNSIAIRTGKILPIQSHYRSDIIKKINDSVYAILFGSIIVAVIQGVLAAIGYYLVGFESVILWGIMTILFALVPFIGTAIIWGPAGLYLLINGLIISDSSMIGKGIGLLIYGVIIVSSVDNILKPKLIGDKAGIHPAFILLGVIGGLALFGVIGLLIGPLVFALLLTFLDIYEKEK